MSTYTPQDLVTMMLDASTKLDAAQDDLILWSTRWSEAEHIYRLAKANAYLATSGTVGEREAYVDKTVAEERKRAHAAEAMKASSLENVRNRRTQLSVLQTVANAIKEEAALARTGGGM